VDGSLRAFELRKLEHGTIINETLPPKSHPPPGCPPSLRLLYIAFDFSDLNYMRPFHRDGRDVYIFDLRSPGTRELVHTLGTH
jgi:DDB1- and CUL4-associated factor 7